MTQPLWTKEAVEINPDVQRYLAGHDVLLDKHLLPYDIEASAAHVQGLQRIGALSEEEATTLCATLRELAALVDKGEFVLDDRYEDGHTAIEAYLTDQLGELGGKVHLGRSRNDQVLVAQRMYIRETLHQIEKASSHVAERCLEIAHRERDTVLPGYTHLQRAVPSTIGLWMASFAEAFIDASRLVQFVAQWLNACPLGTAAGYGVNIPLDREFVSKALGFDRLLINPMYAQTSRGQHEVQALSACWQVMQTVRRLAWDLSLFTTSEFGFVRLGDDVSTGSSIMPNKRNPDLVEVMRAGAAIVAGAMNELQQIVSLPSGYQRDLQGTKAPIIRGLTGTLDTIKLVPTLLDSMEFDREAMKTSIDRELFATDRAVELALEGMPFREAYRRVGAELAHDDLRINSSPEASVAQRISAGSCADLMLEKLRTRLQDEAILDASVS